jgi:DNA invertase Pin-like site-specific DNA recombinase
MFIGYARISPHDQTLTLQKDVLRKAGCSKIFIDTVSAAKAERKELAKALSSIRPGETLVVWKLDRLGTSIKDLLRTMTLLEERGVGFKSLTDTIDTTARGGKQVFRIFGALRNVMREKTTVGLTVARAKGRKGGRPKTLTAQEVAELLELYNNTDIPIPEICRKLQISRPTLYRYVKPKQKQKIHLQGLFAGCVG